MTKILILAFLFTTTWNLSYGIALNCTFQMDSYDYLVYVYQCDAGIILDVENNDVITVIYGTHQSGRTNEDVKALLINGRGMEYFPVNIAQFFPNVVALSFPSNSISYVSNKHLIQLPNLVILRLYNNTITSLDSNLFAGLKSIQYISFAINNITHVGLNFILPNARLIYFNGNPCINEDAVIPYAINALRLSLQVKCSPTISQETLESRPNCTKNIDGQVQSLVNITHVIEQSHCEMDEEVKRLTNTVADLVNKTLQLTTEVMKLRESNLQLTRKVTEVNNEVTELRQNNVENEARDMQQSNVNLNNRNSQFDARVVHLDARAVYLDASVVHLDDRAGYVDGRAGYLEGKFAALETLIKSKLEN